MDKMEPYVIHYKTLHITKRVANVLVRDRPTIQFIKLKTMSS